MYYPDEDGRTNNDRYIKIEEDTGLYPGPDLIIPYDAIYLWEYFIELSTSRSGGFGPAPITYVELKAWSDLTGIVPAAWEVSIIKKMDSKYLEIVNELDKKKAKKKK